MAAQQVTDPVSRSLKGVLLESLQAILSPDQRIRIEGEDQIKLLEVTEEFGVYLAEFTLDPQGALAIRQLASVILKQYVEAHWSQHSDKFRPPETSDTAKMAIRSMLPAGLRETISKVRTSVAYAISAIAHWDWPDAWPQLFGELMGALTSGDSNAVHGAMRVLTEFSREVTDMQMPQVAPKILPEMYNIFINDEVFSIRTRSRAVEIFNTCAGLIFSMNELHKGVAKQLLFPVLSQFVVAFGQALSFPDGDKSDSGLKMEVIKAVTTLVKSFSKQMSQWLPELLPQIWKALTESADVYVRTVVNDTEDADDPVDSDGEVLGFENLVFSIFDFVHGLVETPRFRSTIIKSLDDIVYYIILYMQITEEQVKSWTSNPDQFVEDEDEDTFSYSVRISAQDLLLSVASEFQAECAVGIANAVTRHLQEAEVAKNAGNANWWKVHESCLLTMGSVKALIIDTVSSGNLNFPLNDFLTSVILTDLNVAVSPFLLGRALWAASRFTLAMTPELVQQFLEATVRGLQKNQPPSVRVSSVRAVYGFCDHLKTSSNTQILVPYLTHILDGLIVLATEFAAEVLALVMETLCIVITIDKAFTASVENKVTPLTTALFLKYSQDPLITSLAQDIFKELSQNEACQQPLQVRLLPTLDSILNAPVDKVPLGLASVAMDVLCTIVRNSTVPLSDALITQSFPTAAQCTLRTDDNAVMQSGGECMRAYVSVALEQLIQWHDETGHSGLYYVVQVVSRLLNPRTSEFTAAFVGRLVSTLISKAGTALGSDLDLMLRAVLSKMQQAESLSVVQSLVMVFAHLIHNQLDAVLEFLYNVPGPTGKPALEFVMTEWVARQHLFYGAYDSKVSTTALAKLLEHIIAVDDKRFVDITVKGDQIFNLNEGIRTRSKTAQAPDQWTTIQIHVKMFKLLVNELSNAVETNMSRQASAGGEDLDEDEGWDDCEEDDGDDETEGQTLESMLGMFAPATDFPGYDFECDDDEEDDPDALNDPIYRMDMQAYLTEYFQRLSQQDCYRVVFIPNLNDNEKHALIAAGIPT
ncbi:importin-9 [Saccoglossus kowalevskii]|uniref:Importin-9 n=1 Tax=Saccoglossus kowalevskii TaxID=10224 RepID=A0ABM0MRA4_SACKO|nr:PREDICTED: importin-9 [Saccoglossus kowalevskii]